MNISVAITKKNQGNRRGVLEGAPRSTLRKVRQTLSHPLIEKPVIHATLDPENSRRFKELMSGERAGHFGNTLFTDGNITNWNDVLKDENDAYYPIKDDPRVIGKYASASATMTPVGEPITFVLRGCGTKVAEKDWLTINAYIEAGHEVAGFVYIDGAQEALDHSEKKVRELIKKKFPKKKLLNVFHEAVLNDLYDPHLQYNVIGREVSTFYGLTALNMEGHLDSHHANASSALVRKLGAIHRQQVQNSKNGDAELIATYDHTKSSNVIEAAYSGKAHEKFNLYAIGHFLGIDSPQKYFTYDPKFSNDSYNMSRGFLAKEGFDLIVNNDPEQTYDIRKGVTRLAWDNSAKIPLQTAVSCQELAGYVYDKMKPMMDVEGRLAYHHVSTRAPELI